MDELQFYERLGRIQTELKAPKSLYNQFGKYYYRNAEGICEAVKPLLNKYKCVLFLNDEIQQIGDRFYLKSTATIRDALGSESVSVSALAREPQDKKGMDASQITGTASSYARKYALNGLFLLDDTKDADTDEYHEQTTAANKVSADQYKELAALCKDAGREESYIAKSMKVNTLKDLPASKFETVKNGLLKIIEKGAQNDK